MKHIYVSPHSDDVALSCGGQIISNSAHASDSMVLNVFASEISAEIDKINQDGKLFHGSISHSRVTEDQSAWEYLKISAEWLNIPEAILRNKFPFQILNRLNDSVVIAKIYQKILHYCEKYPDATFYFPAGFGNHVDHLACRAVAFSLLDEGVLDKIVLYEDVPYCWLRFIRNQSYTALLSRVEFERDSHVKAFRTNGADILRYLGRRMAPFPRGKKLFALVYGSLVISNALRERARTKPYCGKVNLIELSNAVVKQKKNLIYHYKSQLPMLFGSNPDRLLRDYRQSFATEVTIEIYTKTLGPRKRGASKSDATAKLAC